MTIVGCDFHPAWQQVAVFDSETGEIRELKLENGNGEAERFYRQLSSPALIGLEACGNTQWFEDLLDRLPTRGVTNTAQDNSVLDDAFVLIDALA